MNINVEDLWPESDKPNPRNLLRQYPEYKICVVLLREKLGDWSNKTLEMPLSYFVFMLSRRKTLGR